MIRLASAVAALLLALSVAALGQGFGLQVADTAGPGNVGAMRVTGGFVMGKFAEADTAFYGARYTYNVLEDLSVFGDVGALDVEDPYELSASFQIGALYTLPVETLPVDLGVRGTVFMPVLDDVSENGMSVETKVWGASLMLIGSGCLEAVPEVSLYGGLGLTHWEAEWKTSVPNDPALVPSKQETENLLGMRIAAPTLEAIARDRGTELALTAGALYQFSEAWSVYGEVSDVEDPLFGAGVRFDF